MALQNIAMRVSLKIRIALCDIQWLPHKPQSYQSHNITKSIGWCATLYTWGVCTPFPPWTFSSMNMLMLCLGKDLAPQAQLPCATLRPRATGPLCYHPSHNGMKYLTKIRHIIIIMMHILDTDWIMCNRSSKRLTLCSVSSMGRFWRQWLGLLSFRAEVFMWMAPL